MLSRAAVRCAGVYFRLHSILLLAASLGVLAAQLRGAGPGAPLRPVFERLYNFDFPGAQELVDREIRAEPQNPLPVAVKAAAYLYSELDRLKILQLDFFTDDDRVVDRRKLTPDPRIRQAFLQSVETAERLAQAQLAARPGDPEALFAMCMTSGVVLDYAALVERRRFGSFPLAKRTQGYARRLLALNPPVYDAYMTSGTIEYVVGSIPFFLRWLVRIDDIKGNKQAGIRQLELVSRQGKYYGPLARTMLAVIHIREKRPAAARELLAGLVADYPENPLFRRELARVEMMRK
jgi:hypothetical protein